MDTNLTAPRQVRLLSCSIHTLGIEQGLSLMPYVQKIDIFESIFTNTLSGTLLLLENVGLVELVPIVGAEIVRLSFSVDDGEGTEQTFEHSFRVTKVHDMSYPRHDFRLYTIELATHEFVQSISSRICRTYRNISCGDAVQDILKLDLDAKLLTYEPTFETVTVTIPNYTPLAAINYFTMLAQTNSTPHESNFLFFETLKGFHFTSIKRLIDEGKTANTIPQFMVNPAAATGGTSEDADVRNAMFRIHQNQTFDLLVDIAGGMLRSKMVHFDFFARKLENEADSRYTESFKKTTHLDKHPVYPENYDQTVSKNTRIFTVPSNLWTANSSYIKSIEQDTPQQLMSEAIVMRNRQLKEVVHLQTLVDMPGHPNLRAGSLATLLYPSTRPLQDQDASMSTPIYEHPTPYHSGLHLITSVHHILTMRKSGQMEYRMNLKACRDSLGSPLVKAREDTTT